MDAAAESAARCGSDPLPVYLAEEAVAVGVTQRVAKGLRAAHDTQDAVLQAAVSAAQGAWEAVQWRRRDEDVRRKVVAAWKATGEERRKKFEEEYQKLRQADFRRREVHAAATDADRAQHADGSFLAAAAARSARSLSQELTSIRQTCVNIVRRASIDRTLVSAGVSAAEKKLAKAVEYLAEAEIFFEFTMCAAEEALVNLAVIGREAQSADDATLDKIDSVLVQIAVERTLRSTEE